MARPLFVITGFGAFEDVLENASQTLVEGLLELPPEGVELLGRVLPVSFTESARAIDELLEELAGRRPALLLGTGVSRDPHFRFERCARPELDTARADADGRLALARPLGESARSTTLALEPLAALLAAASGGPVAISEDAGRYVCERVYYHLLGWSARLAAPALFLHVPRREALAPERQLVAVRRLLELMARELAPPDAR